MAAPTPQADLLNGRYRLLDVVGEGGMAVVWRAHDELLERTVAVKLLRPQYASDPDFLERLRSEAKSAAALNDPGVVSVYDVGEDDGRHYIVMEYVAGPDLKEVIRDESPLPPDRAVAIGAALARAVGAAHAIGLVHRDVKPQNVLVTPDGRMKVADFGIARAASAIGTTAPGIVLGTVHYISPEQAAGDPATPQSDVYSLGVVLYEMLSGRLPFDADSSVGVAMKIMNEAPEPLDSVNPRVPAVLAGIVGRAMARQPEERFPDASALADALDGFARWSDQATGGFRAVPTEAAAGAAAVAASAPKGPGPSGPAIPPPKPVARTEDDGPLLDGTGLLLALVALAALAGLIPLWAAVRSRLDASPDSGSRLPIVGQRATLEPTVVVPTPVPTVASVPVPNVVGQSAEDADTALRRAGFGVTVSTEPSSSAPAGEVIRQVPPPDALVTMGHVVEIVISGEPRVEIPAVDGDWATVSQTLEAYGFVPVQRYEWGGAGSTTAGRVVAIDPPPGNRWSRGAPVYVTVDSGSWLPLGVDFDDNIHLSGVELPRASFVPGEPLAFTAHWEATDTADFGESAGGETGARGNYVVRATLEGPGGQIVALDEHVPVGGSRPTSGWQPGESISNDTFQLGIDPAAAPGQYTLWLEVMSEGEPGSNLSIVQAAFPVQQGGRVRVMRGIGVGGGEEG